MRETTTFIYMGDPQCSRIMGKYPDYSGWERLLTKAVETEGNNGLLVLGGDVVNRGNKENRDRKMKYLDSIAGSGLLNELNKKDYNSALEQLRISDRKYRKNEAVYFEGDAIDSLCIIRKGSVRGEKTFPDGELHIADVYDAGMVFGLAEAVSKTKLAAIDYVSNEETIIVFVSICSIQKSSFAREMERALTFLIADDNIRMSHKIEILVQHGLRDRIITYFSILQSKSGSNKFSVKMNREQMAQFLCVNRSALSNELSKMKKEGIIDFEGHQFIIK